MDEPSCDHEPVGCRYMSTEILPSLQVIASTAIVTSILVKHISRPAFEDMIKNTLKTVEINELEKKLSDECGKNIESLKTPKCIEEALKRISMKVCEELSKCVDYFQFGLFHGSLLPVTGEMRHFDLLDCVWRSNGTIDYRKTAMNLLSKFSTRSDMPQKFVVLCNFCMENELETFDLNSLPENFLDEVDFDEDCLVYYWIRRLRDELREIPLEDFDSIDATMAVTCMEALDGSTAWKRSFPLRPRNAFEYFWNRLSTEDQISLARFLFAKANEFEEGNYDYYFVEVLSALSCYQQRCLLSQIPSFGMIFRVCYNSDSLCWSNSAIRVWTHGKNLVTNDQFRTIIEDMLGKKIHDDEAMRVLIEIWDSASNELKNHLVENAKREITSFFLPPLSTRYYELAPPCLTAVNFFHKFLSRTDSNFRKEIILLNVPVFGGQISDPRPFGEVLDLCLPDLNDQVQFKTLVANSEEMRISSMHLLCHSGFDILKIRLEFYRPADSKACLEYLKLIMLQLSSDAKVVFMHDVNSWNKLSTFIDDMCACANARSSALEMKKLFIISCVSESNGLHFLHKFYGENAWKSMINVVESIFVGENLKDLKRMFLETLAKLYVDESWQKSLLRSLENFVDYFKYVFIKAVSWCLDDDEKAIREFKMIHLPLNVVSDQIFRMIAVTFKRNDEAVYEYLLAKVDEFLKWYMTDEEVKGYKLSRINVLDANLEILRSKSKRKIDGRDEAALRKILMWFSSGDEIARNEVLKPKKLKVSH